MVSRRVETWRREPARLAMALALLLAVRDGAGQTGTWVSHGPVGASIYCLVQDPSQPSTLYAGTQRGVVKSLDGGATWQSSSAGIPPVRVQTIAIDPTTTSTLYAGTVTPSGVQSVGVFKSTDGGATWTDINSGLIDPIAGFSPVDVQALAIDPRHPGTILAGSSFSEIFKSTDGGLTWQPKTLGGFNVSLQTAAFQFDPTDSTKISAATTSGFLRSTDGGESWNVVGNTVSLFALAIDPTTPATLYAGNLSGYGFLKSTDGGSHFVSANKGLPLVSGNNPQVIAIAVDPSHPATVYAGTYGNGLFVSTDGAANWTRADSGIRSAYDAAILLAPGQSSTLTAGTLGSGVYRSSDGAKTWTQMSGGLDLSLVYRLVSDPSAPDVYYAATFDGVQKSVDGAGTWQAAGAGLPTAPVAALALAAGASKTLFAGTLGGGLFKSGDGAATWSASASGLTDSYISSLTVDPTSPSTLYAGTSHPDSSSQRVFKSTDGGATWTQTSLDGKSFTLDSIAVNPGKASQILVGSKGVTGYFQSLDGGKTWSTISSSTACGGTNALVFDPSGATLYMAATGGVCRSTDGGTTWIPSSVAGFSISSVLVDPASPSTLYAGATRSDVTRTSGVFRSTDGGQTWQALGDGFPPSTVTSLAIDPSGKTVHAGTFHAGVVDLVFSKDRPPVQEPSSPNRQPRPLPPR